MSTKELIQQSQQLLDKADPVSRQILTNQIYILKSINPVTIFTPEQINAEGWVISNSSTD